MTLSLSTWTMHFLLGKALSRSSTRPPNYTTSRPKPHSRLVYTSSLPNRSPITSKRLPNWLHWPRARACCSLLDQQMRYNRHYTALRNFVASGALGQVEMMNFLSAKPRHKALNLVGMAQPTLFEMSCHHFDSILSIFPDHLPESITCDGFRPSWSAYDGPCSINALIRFSNGLHILYHGGYSSQSDLYEVRMGGRKRGVTLPRHSHEQRHNALRLCRAG